MSGRQGKLEATVVVNIAVAIVLINPLNYELKSRLLHIFLIRLDYDRLDFINLTL